jgi:hypothetical protein
MRHNPGERHAKAFMQRHWPTDIGHPRSIGMQGAFHMPVQSTNRREAPVCGERTVTGIDGQMQISPPLS